MDIDKLKALALAATPGPWTWGSKYVGKPAHGTYFTIAQCPDGEEDTPAWEAKAAFIAASCPATVLELIAEVERLRAAVEEAAAVFESGAKHNREQGRTVFAHAQQDRANRLRDVSGAHSKAGTPAQDDTNYDRAQLDALGKHGASQ